MESTLSATYHTVTGAVGFFLGYGRGKANGDEEWPADVEAKIVEIVKSGLRQVYWPPLVNGVSHTWSFLQPVATVSLTSGQSTVDLPDDFGSLSGQVLLSGLTSPSSPIPVSSQVRQMHAQYPSSTGRPQMVLVEPLKGTGQSSGQRFQLRVWPTPDASYTLQVPYNILPNCLDGSKPYAYGGAEHAELLIESCLAIAEQRLDDQIGIHTAKFMERLAASISMDRRKQPQVFGYNGDRSDDRNILLRTRLSWPLVTVNGVNPDNY